MPANHASGTAGLLASDELNRDMAGVQGTFGWSVMSGAVTFSSGYIFNVAAVAAGDYTVNSVAGAAYAGGPVTLGTADALLPRIDRIVITAAGAVSVVPGTPRGPNTVYAAPTSGAAATTAIATTGPIPTALTTSQLEIARIYVPANNSPAMSATSITDRRVPLPIPTTLAASAQSFVETAVNKGFFALGTPSAAAVYADADHVGLGFVVQEDATSAVVSASGSPNFGAWSFATGATSGEDAGVIGPYRLYTDDWTLVWRGNIPSVASQTAFIGCRTTGGTFGDENNIIAFRVSGTGNIEGVCDNAGAETTRDSGATGATECTLRIEVRSAGTIVRFYRNNVQIGADVTTNIHTSALITACGIVNSTTADKTMFTHDLYGWREV